ncbi:hypothetical protein FGE12_05755 [Aggregicoccus sp. 17bor-14]|uniref:hypothetical protein n=1 Tax=Myxococcaceae TaxID=31 RepID=UPI00129D0B3C|nr:MULTISPECIES: hypothetical protein [Myxococcaceae]MBF5041888.1 hypothetical protein [Simulacricoccus sp. 17bor-14]MRI87669.1 hypothetical protein [Aggregicoccus sp. 17bor-14]
MIPIGPLIWLAVRAAQSRQGPQAGRVARTYGVGQDLTLLGVVWYVLAGLVLVLNLVAHSAGDLAAGAEAVWWLVAALMFAPWTGVRHLVVPLGMPRLAYWLAAPPDLRFLRDGTGRKALAAAWALLYRRSPPTPKQVAWLERKLGEVQELRPTLLLARGLLAVAQGDEARARVLLEGLDTFDKRVCPPLVLRTASTWLAAQAAEAGDWERVLQLCAQGPRRCPNLWLLSALASRALGKRRAPSPASLWARWVLAGGWWRTFGFVRQLARPLPWPEPTPAAPTGAPETVAFALHVGLWRAAGGADALGTVGARWDAALADEGARTRFFQRAAELGVPGAEGVMLRLREAAGADLAALAEAQGTVLDIRAPQGSLLHAAAWQQRERLYEELRRSLTAMEHRAKEGELLEPHEEWRDFRRVRALYQQLAETHSTDRRAAFYETHDRLCNYGVQLFNVESQRPFGNAIFRFLLEEARTVGHGPSITTQERNVRVGW